MKKPSRYKTTRVRLFVGTIEHILRDFRYSIVDLKLEKPENVVHAAVEMLAIREVWILSYL